MQRAIVITLALAATSGCKTGSGSSVSESDSGRVQSSASRDDRFVEVALKSYQIELRDFDEYTKRQDPNEFFEDFESKQRTNFVTFQAGDTSCVVGLTTEGVNSLRAAKNLKMAAKPNPPGRTSGGYRSEVSFVFKNTKGKDDQFLASCTNQKRRVTMADLESSMGTFMRFRAAGPDTPTYDVCCECATDIYQVKKVGAENLMFKGERNYYWMDQSNDSVCQTGLLNKKFSLRPGDRHFTVSEERYQVWTTCEETADTRCPARDAEDKKPKRVSDASEATKAPAEPVKAAAPAESSKSNAPAFPTTPQSKQ